MILFKELRLNDSVYTTDYDSITERVVTGVIQREDTLIEVDTKEAYTKSVREFFLDGDVCTADINIGLISTDLNVIIAAVVTAKEELIYRAKAKIEKAKKFNLTETICAKK